MSEIPAEHRHEYPRVSRQLSEVSKVHELNKLHQLTDLAAPATQVLPAVEV
jgi:hypothetical protein